MSAGKNPILRYGIIDHCLSSKHTRYWSPEALIDKFAEYDLQVELRTLKYDMQNMRENSQLNYNAPIAYCRKNKGYYYTEDGYTINGTKLSQDDLMALAFVVSVSEQFEDTDMVKRAKGTITKLNKANKLLRPETKPNLQLISFEPKPYYKGLRYLGILVEAIFNRQVLCVAYQKFQDESPGDHIFHPYQLKTYNHRWYVRGYSERRNEVIILGLERIENVREEKVQYREDVATEDKEYFFHTIGVTKGSGEVEDIELEFTPGQGHYIKTLHLHHSQRILKDDHEGLIIHLRLIQNYELCQLILGFMAEVKVLKPLSLRNKVKSILQNTLELYASTNLI